MIDKVLSLFKSNNTNSSEVEMSKEKKSKRLKEIFSAIPTIETERLILRKIHVDDFADMYNYASDNDITRYLTWYSHSSPVQTKEYLEYLQKRYDEGKFYDWCLELKENQRMIGTCGFTSININQNKGEIGYVLNKKYWGRGLMPEAAVAVMKFGYQNLHFEKIEARFIDGNIKSLSVMKKLGMTFEGTIYKSFHVKDEYKTVHTYSVTKEKFYSLFGKKDQ